MTEKDEKLNQSLLEQTLKEIEKTFGKGTVMKLGDRPNIKCEVIPSGSLLLDSALGVGGYPKGRIVEIYGPESSGKTTLALSAIAECQKAGGRAAFIDAEHSIDPEYARNLGVNIDELLLCQPSSGEEALDVTTMLAGTSAINMIVVDSVAALTPQAELDGVMSDNQVGLQARLMSKALRKLVGTLNKSNCLVIFINQLREKVGVLYGNPETTTGGKALKFYATIRLDIRRNEALKNGSDVYGNTVKIKVVKNKVAPPFKTCVIDIVYGKGISKESELLDVAEELQIVRRTGAWYEYNGDKIGQGKENSKQFLLEHPDISQEIKDQIQKHFAEINNIDSIED